MPPEENSVESGSLRALEHKAKALFEARRPRLALAACREILALQPARPDVLGFAGMLAERLGQIDAAVEFYRATIVLAPDHVEAQYNLARMLQRLGQLEAAEASYRRALSLQPGLVPAWHNLGGLLQRLDRPGDAIAAYEQALAQDPGSAETAHDLAGLLRKSGRGDEAVAIYRRGLAAAPANARLRRSLVHALLERGEASAAAAACASWVAASPDSVEALALSGAALNEAGDEAGARRLLDFDRFLQIVEIAPPAGYDGLAAFNAALAAHVLSHPTLQVPPWDDPTYHNEFLKITGELLVEPRGPMAALERAVRQAIDRYRATVPAMPPHPFLAHWPAHWRLASWATLLEGQGNLVPHIHLGGYLGLVYYVELPAAMGADDGNQAGWFELGRPALELPCRAPPILRRVAPREGRLLLFPGYFFHSTVPFALPGRRISIAFDLVPGR